jgi:putative oxidoreductase
MSSDLALFVLRVVVGVVIFAHGAMKLGWVGKGGSIAGVGGWFDSRGMKPGIFWALVAVAGGGVLMILGLGGPIGPSIVAADLVVVTVVAHLPKGFWAHEGGWEFPVPVAAGAFAVALIGNGTWSLDAMLGLKYPEGFGQVWGALMVAGVVLVLVIRAIAAPKPSPKT